MSTWYVTKPNHTYTWHIKMYWFSTSLLSSPFFYFQGYSKVYGSLSYDFKDILILLYFTLIQEDHMIA